MEELQRRLSSFFEPSHSRSNSLRKEDESMTAAAEWAPLVDIVEDEKEYLITAELPEVKREDVKVTVENGTLTLTGDRHFESEQNGKKYHRVERSYGRFVRTFTLPDNVDANRVNADFKDGTLKVHLTKSENARARQIDVKVS